MCNRKRWRAGVVAGLGMIMAGCAASGPATSARKVPAATSAAAAADPVAQGRQVYQAQCVQCHGRSGRGDGRVARDLTVRPADLTDMDLADESDAAILRRMFFARRPMPDVEKILSGDEQRAVIAYVRTLASPATASNGG